MKPCRFAPVPSDLEKGGKTAGAAAELGGRVAVEDVRTFGRAVEELFQGGSEEAGQKWTEGADRTRSVARGESAEVKAAANAPPCAEPPR